MEYRNILVEKQVNAVLITLNRPAVLNALDPVTIDELSACLAHLSNNRQVRVVIITGAGDRAFSAGADMAMLRSAETAEAARELAQRGQALFARIERAPQPVIVAINGVALGGGCEMALACDFRIASDRARIGLPEINLGIIPGWGGTQRLPRLVGVSVARQIIYSGEMVGAKEALRMGLVDRVVPAAELIASALEWAEKLATKAPLAMAAAKRAIHLGMQHSLEHGLQIEMDEFAGVYTTRDRAEGLAAFREKRPARFNGN